MPPDSHLRHATHHCLAERFRHARSLRGRDEGRHAGDRPDVALVDLSHDLPAHDMPRRRAGARGDLQVLSGGRRSSSWSSIRASARSAAGIAAEAGDWQFVAPDNGVLTAVFQETPPKRVVELTERRYARPTVSRTFEGRDRFAPAAAWLAQGHAAAGVRPAITDYPDARSAAAAVRRHASCAAVVRIDRFGNVVTNLDRKSCEKLADGPRRAAAHRRRAADRAHRLDLLRYRPGEIGALFGSTDHLECACRAASAAERLGVAVGDAGRAART